MLWRTNNENGRKIKNWWRTRELERKKKLGQTNCIMVQKMNPMVTGKLKKCELEARKYVDLRNLS